jgi:hypothetical protein
VQALGDRAQVSEAVQTPIVHMKQRSLIKRVGTYRFDGEGAFNAPIRT